MINKWIARIEEGNASGGIYSTLCVAPQGGLVIQICMFRLHTYPIANGTYCGSSKGIIKRECVIIIKLILWYHSEWGL